MATCFHDKLYKLLLHSGMDDTLLLNISVSVLPLLHVIKNKSEKKLLFFLAFNISMKINGKRLSILEVSKHRSFNYFSNTNAVII